jgi:hypothetical protein
MVGVEERKIGGASVKRGKRVEMGRRESAIDKRSATRQARLP